MKKKLTGDRGEKLVLEELSRRGYIALLAGRPNHPVYDIECHTSGWTCFVVQVKNSTSSGTQAWIGLTAVDGPLRNDLYFVILREWDQTKAIPDFFCVNTSRAKRRMERDAAIQQ